MGARTLSAGLLILLLGSVPVLATADPSLLHMVARAKRPVEKAPRPPGGFTQSQPQAPAAKPEAPPAPADGLPPESVEADVSTRSVAITSGFTGTEIIVFGSVDNSRQESAEAGYYDVVVVVEGLPTSLVARRKTNVAGIWLNTSAVRFDSVPSYYAIASTRPLEEIADAKVLASNQIGFEYVTMLPGRRQAAVLLDQQLKEYEQAVVRIKQRDGLYVADDYSVVFIGRSLFRSSIDLPANVPVGPLTARVYLFRQGALLSQYTARVNLTREGLERFLYDAAIRYPLLYGIMTVTLAVGAGLLASAVFRRSAH